MSDNLLVLDELKKAVANPLQDNLSKAWTTGTGLVNYDLQRPALRLYTWGELMTPLRNEIARVQSNNGDTATRWKAITGLNTTNVPAGISEGNRGGTITSTVGNYTSPYVGLGLEDSVSFEADYAATGFDDVKAQSAEGTLQATMLAEERMIYGGNASVALGTPTTPTGTGAATAGALSDGTYYVGVVALTHEGWQRASVAAGVTQQISRTNADGTTDTLNGGTSHPSAYSSGVTLSAGTAVQRVSATVPPITGAVAYAWYLGSSTSHQYLQQITTINSVNFTTALVTTTQDFQTLAATDNSKNVVNGNQYSFDGLLYQGPFGSATGSYLKVMATGTAGAGSTLTSDGAGGIVEINAALQAFYDNYKLSPDTMWMNSQQIIDISNKVIAGGGAPLFRFNMDAKTENVSIIAGAVVGSYLNKITMQLVKVRVHPFAVPGTILFTSKTLPQTYPSAGITTVARIKTRKEYYMTEWPLVTRKYQYGTYVDELLQVQFFPAFGAITNIAAG